jgi:hypothetical protein
MGDEKNKDFEELKKALSTREGLAIICYYLHNKQFTKLNMQKIAKNMKMSIQDLKAIGEIMEKMGAVKVNKLGELTEIEIPANENESVKKVMDKIVWEKKEEYGKLYKELLTAEMIDFLGGNKEH